MSKNIMGLSLYSLITAALLLIAGCTTLQTSQNISASPVIDRIQKHGELILGTSADQPPLSQLNKQGIAEGFDLDIAKMMASAMGVKLTVRILPFNQLISALQKGEVDIVLSNLTITPDRNLKVAFAGPYMTSGKCVLTKDPQLAKADTAQILNSNKIRVVAQKGTTSENFVRHLMPEAKLSITEKNDQAVSMLRDNKVDVMITDLPICMSTINSEPEAGFISAFSLLTYEPIGVAIPANDALFINWTTNFLQRLEDTETLDQLGHRWFGKFTRIQKTSVTM